MNHHRSPNDQPKLHILEMENRDLNAKVVQLSHVVDSLQKPEPGAALRHKEIETFSENRGL